VHGEGPIDGNEYDSVRDITLFSAANIFELVLANIMKPAQLKAQDIFAISNTSFDTQIYSETIKFYGWQKSHLLVGCALREEGLHGGRDAQDRRRMGHAHLGP